ncbi:alpha/beta hydrolase [Desulfamplus magnetovallimortis]|nr:alpha/beta hydrolase [Desulfamplus magnetovallimortis]
MKKKISNTLLSLFIVIFYVSVSYAEQYNTDAVDLNPGNLNLTIKNMEIQGNPTDIQLTFAPNPADPENIYWKLGDITPGLQMKTVYKDTFAYRETITTVESDPLERHQLDIYYTDNPTSNKVIMFVPGGAWRQGDKDSYEALGKTLVGIHGFTLAVVNYRISNDTGGNAVHPDHIQDVASAFKWLKQNIAPYGDPDTFYLFGQSAGAHLVSLLATDRKWLNAVGYDLSDIKGVISMSASYYLPDLVTYPDNPLGLSADDTVVFKKLMLDAFGGWSDADLVDPSPQSHINPDQPPFLVIYSYNDISGFGPEAENFVKAVKTLDPAPEIALRAIEFSDYTDEVWETAVTQASQEPVLAEFVGHWAEVIAINPNEPTGYVTKLIVEFFQSH